jgi:hypothetical protein
MPDIEALTIQALTLNWRIKKNGTSHNNWRMRLRQDIYPLLVKNGLYNYRELAKLP